MAELSRTLETEFIEVNTALREPQGPYFENFKNLTRWLSPVEAKPGD